MLQPTPYSCETCITRHMLPNRDAIARVLRCPSNSSISACHPRLVEQVGYLMLKTGTLNTLELMSKEEGKHMDNPESVNVRLLHTSPA